MNIWVDLWIATVENMVRVIGWGNVALQLATNDYPNKQLIIIGYCKFSFTCRVGSSSYMTHSFTSGPEEDLFIWFKNNGRSFLENLSSPPDFSGKCVARPLFFCVVLGRSLFVLLSFFFWSLCCLSFFDLWIRITPLVSSSYSIAYASG